MIDADALMETIQDNEYELLTKHNSKGNGMFTLGIQQAVDEAPTIEPVKWIPVSERLPEVLLFEQADDDWVSDRGYPFLVTYDDRTIDIELFWSKTGFSDCDSSVTNWMPLPDPPRKDDEA